MGSAIMRRKNRSSSDVPPRSTLYRETADSINSPKSEHMEMKVFRNYSNLSKARSSVAIVTGTKPKVTCSDDFEALMRTYVRRKGRSRKTITSQPKLEFNFEQLRPPKDPDLIKCIKRYSERRKERMSQIDKFNRASKTAVLDAASGPTDQSEAVDKKFQKHLRRLRRRSSPEGIFSPSSSSINTAARRISNEARRSLSPAKTAKEPIRGDYADHSDSISVDRRVNRLQKYISRLITFEPSSKVDRRRRHNRNRSTSSQGEIR